jgi:hypothetical protein
VVPHRGTNWAALWLTAQIGRDAVLSDSYDRGYKRAPTPRIYVDHSCLESEHQHDSSNKEKVRASAPSSDIQRKVTSVISHGTRPPLSAQRTKPGWPWWPTLLCLLGSSKTEGECKAFRTGGVLLFGWLEWKLRMQRASFSSWLKQAKALPKSVSHLNRSRVLCLTPPTKISNSVSQSQPKHGSKQINPFSPTRALASDSGLHKKKLCISARSC